MLITNIKKIFSISELNINLHQQIELLIKTKQMAITFQPINERQIKAFFKLQKDINRRFRSGEFIEEAILEKINKQSTLQPSSGLSIEEGVKHRGSNISNMIKDQGSLADEFAKTSSNPQEKTQLKTFSEDATKLSKIVDKVTSLETTDKNVQDLLFKWYIY